MEVIEISRGYHGRSCQYLCFYEMWKPCFIPPHGGHEFCGPSLVKEGITKNKMDTSDRLSFNAT